MAYWNQQVFFIGSERAVQDFAETRPLMDDMTLAVIRRKTAVVL